MSSSSAAKIHWFARLEHRFHVWRERRARRRGRSATIVPFPGYGGTGWVRVTGRVLIVPPPPKRARGEGAGVRGWRAFVGIPVSFASVQVHLGGRTHDVVADRGGVVDTVIEAHLQPGWQTFTMSVEGREPVEAAVFVVGDDARFGVVCDVDDTVMVTALPRPFIAAWNSFVLDEHARTPVPGMAVLQFGFTPSERDTAHVPRNWREWQVVYTGTHDHDTIRGWYESLRTSGQAIYYTASDWASALIIAKAIARFEERPSAHMLTAILSGFGSLAATEGERRRLRIELERAEASDADEEAAVTALNEWRDRLSG